MATNTINEKLNLESICINFPSCLEIDKTYKSLNEKYDKINDLQRSQIDECLEIIKMFYDNHQSKIIDYLKNNIQLEKYQKSCLNCLYVSINIISKYIEKNRPSTSLKDFDLFYVFDRFFDMISSHHLVERICEAILYTMCSIILYTKNLENRKWNHWKEKLELCFYNNKINKEIKLASSVILVQLDISNIKLIREIAGYLFKNINIKYCQDFGFTQSEINGARKNALKTLINNCEKTKAASSLEIFSIIGCEEAHLKEIEICLNEIRDEANKAKDYSFHNKFSEEKIFPNYELLSKRISTSKKQESFQSGPIGIKPVTDLPGIGSVSGTRLKDNGNTKASQNLVEDGEDKECFYILSKKTAYVKRTNANKSFDACDQHSQQNLF